MYTREFARRALEIMQMSEKWEPPQSLPEEAESGEAMKLFQALQYEDDLAYDADLIGLAHYLRGCTGLRIPELWRPLMPGKL